MISAFPVSSDAHAAQYTDRSERYTESRRAGEWEKGPSGSIEYYRGLRSADSVGAAEMKD
jgi:hypothetical protein